MYVLLSFDRHYFTDSLGFADSMNDFSDEAGWTSVYDFGKMIELENLTSIVFDELSIS